MGLSVFPASSSNLSALTNTTGLTLQRTYTSTQLITDIPTNITRVFAVVIGGGGGGAGASQNNSGQGGGGGGGVSTGWCATANYVYIGAGGAGGAAGSAGVAGGASVYSTIAASGGGNGTCNGQAAQNPAVTLINYHMIGNSGCIISNGSTAGSAGGTAVRATSSLALQTWGNDADWSPWVGANGSNNGTPTAHQYSGGGAAGLVSGAGPTGGAGGYCGGGGGSGSNGGWYNGGSGGLATLFSTTAGSGSAGNGSSLAGAGGGGAGAVGNGSNASGVTGGAGGTGGGGGGGGATSNSVGTFGGGGAGGSGAVLLYW